jgi:hypothetical protein
MGAVAAGLIRDLLNVLLGQVGADATNNALIFPTWRLAKDAQPTNPRTDVLQHAEGGIDKASALRPRVVAVVGPGMTFPGLAGVLLSWFRLIDPNTALTPDQVAHALLFYNTNYLPLLYADGVPVTKMDNFKVGFQLYLPIELDDSQGWGPNPPWIFNLPQIQQWADAYDEQIGPDQNILMVASARLTATPSFLPQKSAAEIIADAQSLIVANPDVPSQADALSKALLTNSSEAVLLLDQVFALQPEPLTESQLNLALSLTPSFVDHLFALLASLTGGNAVLRRLKAIFDGANAANLPNEQQQELNRAKDLINNALFQPPVGVIPNEPPLSPSQLDFQPKNVLDHPITRAEAANLAAAHRDIQPPDLTALQQANQHVEDGKHRLVFGRDVLAGGINQQPVLGFVGPLYWGRVRPDDLIHDPAVMDRVHQFWVSAGLGEDPARPNYLDNRLDIIAAIAVNEGGIDGIRLRDAAVVSFGIQMWSSALLPNANAVELPAFMILLKENFPATFDLYFRGSVNAPGGVQVQGLDVQRLGIDGVGNPQGELQLIQGNGQGPAAFADQLAPFGGNQQGGTTFLNSETSLAWAARFRLAAITSRDVQVAELAWGAARFDRVLRQTAGHQFQIGHMPFDITAVASSQVVAALVLDANINQPKPAGGFSGIIDAVINNVENLLLPPGAVASPNNQVWIQTFAVAYAHALGRVGPGNIDRGDRILTLSDFQFTPLPTPQSPNPQARRGDGTLSSAPNSFIGWVGIP